MKLFPKMYTAGMHFDNVEVIYKHEAGLGSTICCFYNKTENDEHIVTIKNKETHAVHAIIKLY